MNPLSYDAACEGKLFRSHTQDIKPFNNSVMQIILPVLKLMLNQWFPINKFAPVELKDSVVAKRLLDFGEHLLQLGNSVINLLEGFIAASSRGTVLDGSPVGVGNEGIKSLVVVVVESDCDFEQEFVPVFA